MQPEMTEHAATMIKAIKATSIATYTASGSAVIFGLSAEVFAALAGVIIAIIAATANIGLTWYFKHQHREIERERLNMEREWMRKSQFRQSVVEED